MLVLSCLGGCSWLLTSTDVSVSQNNLLFYDDFSNPRSGWSQWDGGQTQIAYQGGGLRFLIGEPHYDYWSLAGLEIKDAILAVEARVVGGPPNNDFGLICRYQGPDQFYAFVVSSDGYTGIVAVDGDGYHILTDSGLTYVASVDRGLSTYLLRADCVGSSLALYVDRQKLLEIEDHRYNSGDVGVFAGTFDETGVEVVFDNFYVLKP